MANCWGAAQALKERGNVFGGSKAYVFSYFDGKEITTYMPIETIEYFKKKGEKYLNPIYFKKYQTKYRKETKDWWDFIRKIERKDYSKIKTKELIADHYQFTLYMRDALSYFGSTRTEFTFASEKKLELILKKYFKEKWINIFSDLVESTELDDIQKEHFARLSLLGKNLSDKKILVHLSKFPWLIFGEISSKISVLFIKGILKKEKGNYKNAFKSSKDRKERLGKIQELILKKIGKERNQAAYLSDFLRTQAVERMNIKAYWAGCYYLARNMWFKIAEVIGANINDALCFLTPTEIQSLLKNKYHGDISKIVALRKKYYAIVYGKGRDIKIYDGNGAKELFYKKIFKKREQEEIIKGQPACPGFYRGKVRKVVAGDLDMLKESIRDFKKGEVLVSSMTQPNMMVIARRAGAIIADEGGITSHAAIISRELKIPCIVGCLKAMALLKDGDLVEVDAESGVVRILK